MSVNRDRFLANVRYMWLWMSVAIVVLATCSCGNVDSASGSNSVDESSTTTPLPMPTGAVLGALSDSFPDYGSSTTLPLFGNDYVFISTVACDGSGCNADAGMSHKVVSRDGQLRVVGIGVSYAADGADPTGYGPIPTFAMMLGHAKPFFPPDATLVSTRNGTYDDTSSKPPDSTQFTIITYRSTLLANAFTPDSFANDANQVNGVSPLLPPGTFLFEESCDNYQNCGWGLNVGAMCEFQANCPATLQTPTPKPS